MVQEDWKIAQNIRLTDSENEDDIRNLKFKFSFQEGQIFNSMLKMPLEYETNIASFKEQVEADPPISFDDLVPFDPIECLEFEVNKYPRLPLPAMSNYDSQEVGK